MVSRSPSFHLSLSRLLFSEPEGAVTKARWPSNPLSQTSASLHKVRHARASLAPPLSPAPPLPQLFLS